MEEAAGQGAHIIAFAETWLPGYPAFMWVGDDAYRAPLKQTYLENSLVLGDKSHQRLEAASKDLDLTLVTGLSQRIDERMYMGTLIVDRGTTLHAQQKLKPSGAEWDIFHSGTADTYAVLDSSVGRLGALSCNENRRVLLADRYQPTGITSPVSAYTWPRGRCSRSTWASTA